MSSYDDVIEQYLSEPDIHEKRRAGIAGAGVAMVVAFIATILHGINTYLAFWTDTSLLLVIIIHAVLCAVVLLISAIIAKAGRDSRFMLLLGVTTIFTGVFGAAGTFFAALLHIVWHMRFSHTFADWFATIFPHFKKDKPEEVYEDIVYGRDDNPVKYSVVPFLDVMTIGSEEQKREAISRMTVNFHPSFAEAFRKALNDSSNSIRVQAANAVARIEGQFLERMIKLSEIEKNYPDNADIKLAQAEHYDDYAFTGILDREREESNRRNALRYYQEYLKMKPASGRVRIRVGRILLRQRRYDEAADWFANCVNEGFNNDALMVWYLESLYAAGRFTTLRNCAKEFANRIDNIEGVSPKVADSMRLWATAA